MEADPARSVLNALTLLARASLAAPLGYKTLRAFSPKAQHLEELRSGAVSAEQGACFKPPLFSKLSRTLSYEGRFKQNA